MSLIDYISIVLAVFSIILGLFSIVQSKKYNKASTILNQETRELEEKISSNIDSVFILSRNVFGKNETVIDLAKDSIMITKTSVFKQNKVTDMIEPIQESLSSILKQTYINHVIRFITSKSDEEICIVSLKNRITNLEEKKELDRIRKELNKYGLNISLLY